MRRAAPLHLRISLIYSAKVWLTTAGLAPVIILITSLFTPDKGASTPMLNYVILYIVFAFGGIIYAVLPIIIFSYVVSLILLKDWRTDKGRVVLLIIAEVILTIAMYGIVYYEKAMSGLDFSLWLTYAVVIAGAVFFYKLNSLTNEQLMEARES